jgi:cell wall-associated NlpC family hydrolase
MLVLYARAALTCRGLPWSLLAAVGTVESGNGTSTLRGVRSGQNAAGAEGPMQFLPGTFASYSEPVPGGGAEPPNPYDPADAVFAAARMLCADGAADPALVGAALWDYNHLARYVAQVLSVAQSYGYGDGGGAAGGGAAGSGAPRGGAGDAGLVAVEYALAQIGTPYRWGGETAAVGFDCSGLAQAAWESAGVAVPRVAQAQFDAGPSVGASALEPGDLVFFGRGPTDVSHVGLVVTASVMVDAPHTGADVRIEQFPDSIGARWGSDVVVGMTEPGAVPL